MSNWSDAPPWKVHTKVGATRSNSACASFLATASLNFLRIASKAGSGLYASTTSTLTSGEATFLIAAPAGKASAQATAAIDIVERKCIGLLRGRGNGVGMRRA